MAHADDLQKLGDSHQASVLPTGEPVPAGDFGPWVPGPDVKDYAGNPLPQDVDFFAPPPPELGTVERAYSTLRRAEQPLGRGARLAWSFAFVPFGGLAGLAVVWWFEVGPALSILAWLVVPSALVGVFAWYAMGFAHSCSYVGQHGVARFRCYGSRERLTAQEILLFRPDLRCEVSGAAYYRNGVYQSTSYRYSWKDADGGTVYTVEGTHRSETNTPPRDNEYWYGSTAYAVWDRYRQVQIMLGALLSVAKQQAGRA